MALGQSESEEYQIGLAEIADTLKGNVGLFFTNLGQEEVCNSSDLDVQCQSLNFDFG